MARFDDELIRRLKEETDIVRLIESYEEKVTGAFIGWCDGSLLLRAAARAEGGFKTQRFGNPLHPLRTAVRLIPLDATA